MQVPEAGSGRFRRVPVYNGVGPVVGASSGRLQKILAGSGVCWRRLARKVLEGSGGGEFRRVLV